MNNGSKEILLGKTIEELSGIFNGTGFPGYVSEQIAGWIYEKGVRHVSEMTNISRRVREVLEESYDIGITNPAEVRESSDGTKKYLFSVGAAFIETAYIPEDTRATLCVSTQAGCARACRFCMTGRQGLQRNLSAGEILNQYAALPEKQEVTNIVYMGMGEPLDNLDPVLASLRVLTSQAGYGLSPRRITVSTVGILPQFEKLYRETDCNIAVSLHSPWPEERARIMPVEKEHPAHMILEFLKAEHVRQKARQRARSRRKISFEYILFDGINDSAAHANELVRILHGIRCRVNLIPFNQGGEGMFKPARKDMIDAFRKKLVDKGMIATIRKSRGSDIDAACGLLSTRRLL